MQCTKAEVIKDKIPIMRRKKNIVEVIYNKIKLVPRSINRIFGNFFFKKFENLFELKMLTNVNIEVTHFMKKEKKQKCF